MMKKITLTTFCLLFFCLVSVAKVYYTSPRGKETDLRKVTRDNPADWRAITQGEMARQLQCGDSVLLRWDQGIYTEGTRIYASGCSDTYEGAIHYMSEPGGFAVFRIKKYPQNNFRHIDRQLNPSGIVVGAEVHWKTSNQSNPVNGWNTRDPNRSETGRYVWIREIVMQGNYGDKYPKRDLSVIKNMPYGSTGERAPGTIAGGQNYDDMTGFISIHSLGSRVINCVFWNLGHSGVAVNSALRNENATFYGNVITNTGHSSPERDRFHSLYQQWGSLNRGRLIHKHSIIQFSAEEQLQLWAQNGINSNTGESKVDNIDLIENVLINGGTLSGKKHRGRIAPNAKVGGYTFDTNIRIIGNISWHDKGGNSWQSGFSLNSNNDRRNLYVKNNYFVGNGAIFRNVSSIKEVSGNTFVALNGTQMSYEVTSHKEKGMLTHARKWNNNAFYGGGIIHYSKWKNHHARESYAKLSFDDWKRKGFDRSSSYDEEYPNDMIKYFSNEYLEYYDSDWRGHVVVMNFSRQGKKYIDISKFGLNQGDKYRIIDVQNIGGDLTGKFVHEGTFNPSRASVAVDMVDHNSNNVVQDPTGEMVGPFGTDRRFATFLVIRTQKGAQKPNQMPIAKAGEDQKITLPDNKVIIDGSESMDPDGTIVAYACEKVSGPDSYKIGKGNTNKPEVSNLKEGTYTFKLKVTDNFGASSEDQVKITVEPEPRENQQPTASAGSDQTLDFPDNSITLDGTGSSDKDGEIASYQWRQISGPSPIEMEGENTGQLKLSNLKPGTYQFRLTVTDDEGKNASDVLQLVVNPEKQQENQDDDNELEPPVAGLQVTSFSLINANTNKPIAGFDPIPEGAVINKYDLPTLNLNIRANMSQDKVGSVMFSYNDRENYRTENIVPYELAGDKNKDSDPWTPGNGNHSVKATPFTKAHRGGEKGEPLTLNFKVINEAPQVEEPEKSAPVQKVESFSLINANTNKPIAGFDPIPEGAVINKHDLPTLNLNIRANMSQDKVGSVMFSYNGRENYRTENLVPYELAGDKNRHSTPWTPGNGNHFVKATPFTKAHRGGEKGEPLTLNFKVINEAPQVEEPEKPAPVQKVESFSLINANTNKPIAGFDPIPEGAVINKHDLPTLNLNIRANMSQDKVGSVMFSYNGRENYRTENLVPYELAGDKNRHSTPWTPGNGNHSVKATPFTKAHRGGEKGESLALNFRVINEEPQNQQAGRNQSEILSFTLIDADKNKAIAAYDPIPAGAVINLRELPTSNLNIRANITSDKVGSVRFAYNGKENFRIENLPPYALHSDKFGNYYAWTPDLGTHSITATSYSKDDAKGEQGSPLAINFTIDSFMPNASARTASAPKYRVYPNPNTGVFELEPEDKSIKILSVAIYDSFGNKVYDKDYNKYFNIEQFALGLVKSGLYKIIVTTEKSVDYQRMIVEF